MSDLVDPFWSRGCMKKTAKSFFQPVSAIEMPRFAGMPTFMRLPHLTAEDP